MIIAITGLIRGHRSPDRIPLPGTRDIKAAAAISMRFSILCILVYIEFEQWTLSHRITSTKVRRLTTKYATLR